MDSREEEDLIDLVEDVRQRKYIQIISDGSFYPIIKREAAAWVFTTGNGKFIYGNNLIPGEDKK